jgi:hypothetical protein
MENLNNSNLNITCFLSNAVNKFSNDWNKQFKGLPESIIRNIEHLNTNGYLLSTFGWYISENMMTNHVFKIFADIKNNKINSAEDLLLKYFRKNIGNIKSSLIEKFPNRQELITEAFKAHQQKICFSSTILFLSQADGICDGKFFQKDKLKYYLLDKKYNFMINAVLGKESAINVDTRKKDKSNYFSNLNRNGVMHGLHLDYGNEKNSLKALSLFCFLSDFIRH